MENNRISYSVVQGKKRQQGTIVVEKDRMDRVFLSAKYFNAIIIAFIKRPEHK